MPCHCYLSRTIKTFTYSHRHRHHRRKCGFSSKLNTSPFTAIWMVKRFSWPKPGKITHELRVWERNHLFSFINFKASEWMGNYLVHKKFSTLTTDTMLLSKYKISLRFCYECSIIMHWMGWMRKKNPVILFSIQLDNINQK